MQPEEEDKPSGVGTWVFFAGDFKEPVKIPLEYDIVGALWAADKAAWNAVIEYVHGHLRARENPAD